MMYDSEETLFINLLLCGSTAGLRSQSWSWSWPFLAHPWSQSREIATAPAPEPAQDKALKMAFLYSLWAGPISNSFPVQNEMLAVLSLHFV